MRFFLKILLVIILFLAVIVSQYYFDVGQKKQIKPQPYLMPAQVVKAADLGLNAAASDYTWLSMIQYFGDWRDDGYEKLDDYINLANDLDPKFSYPYAFGTLILPGRGMTDQAIEIGNRGIAESDPNWKIPYYMAITYFSKLDDYTSAAKYFDIAAHTPGAPEGVQQVAANFGTRPDVRKQTEQIWESIYDNSNDQVVKEHALAYIQHFAVMDVLELAAKIYEDEKGSYPANVSDMVSAGILKYVPTDPFGYEYSIDKEGRARVKN